MNYPEDLAWLANPLAALNEAARTRARARQGQLTKPAGSLGRLEALAEDFAAWQGSDLPQLGQVGIRLFAADHGIAARGVSAFPQAVTAQMILNFCAGGAAICVLGRSLQADFGVVNLGCVVPVADHPLLLQHPLGPGTADFTETAAMTEAQLAAALNIGRRVVSDSAWSLFVGGEMGIGNTTAASALIAAILKADPKTLVGPGTGVSGSALAQKCARVSEALALHTQSGFDSDTDSRPRSHMSSHRGSDISSHISPDRISDIGPDADLASSEPLRLLRCLGGFEIAALVGAYITCAQRGVPAMVDGFITSAAALVACRLNPAVRGWLLFGHKSSEPGHRLVLQALEAEPLLDLNLRLGEGSGAALAVTLVQQALALHRDMATFGEAGVSQ